MVSYTFRKVMDTFAFMCITAFTDTLLLAVHQVATMDADRDGVMLMVY